MPCPLCNDGRTDLPACGYCGPSLVVGGVTRTVPKDRASAQAELAAIDARLQAAYAAGFQSAAPAEGSECAQPDGANGVARGTRPTSNTNGSTSKRKPKRKPTKRTSEQVTRGAAQAERDQRAAAFWTELGTAVDGQAQHEDEWLTAIKTDSE